MIDCIKIGPATYRVIEADDDHMIGSDGSGKAVRLNGDIMYHSLLIRVNATSAPDMKLITLWHEAIHGILKMPDRISMRASSRRWPSASSA